jgi:hypothetical protein
VYRFLDNFRLNFWTENDSNFNGVLSSSETIYFSTVQFHFTPHHITSHHITSHYTTPHHITSHHTTLHHTTSHHITSHHITLHHTSHHITPHHITSHHITSHHSISYHINLTIVQIGEGRGKWHETGNTEGWRECKWCGYDVTVPCYRSSSLSRLYNDTQKNHAQYDSPGRVISPKQTPPPPHLTTHKHSHKTEIHTPAGFVPRIQQTMSRRPTVQGQEITVTGGGWR